MSWTLKKEDGDILVENSTGQVRRIFNEEKATQDVADVLMTDLDPERKFGSNLSKIPGQSSGPNILSPFGNIRIQDECRNSIQRLIDIQNNDGNLSRGEAIEELYDIRVIKTNRTDYLFNLRVKLYEISEPRNFNFKMLLGHQLLSSNKRNFSNFGSDDFT